MMIGQKDMVDRSDEQLIARASAGDKEAYGLIVKRYQNLVCSLAYSACGDFSQSEDLAQETFVVAWKKLSGLRDATRLRAWLCGIARNLVANHLRKQKRSGASATLPLDAVDDPESDAASAPELLTSDEEDQVIWRSLESIPENYRTALVLFYRQDQSVNEVAEALEISPEAARQRLSRGRALLRDKVLSLVERGLSGSRPGKAFTVATLAALPALAGQATAAGVAVATAKTSTAAKTAAGIGFWGAILGPLAGLLGGYVGARASINSARSPRERSYLVKLTRWTLALTILFATSLTLLLVYGAEIRAKSGAVFAALIVGLVVAYGVGLTVAILWANRRLEQIFAEDREQDALYPKAAAIRDREPSGYKSKASLFGLPLVHIAVGGASQGTTKRAKAVGWIAIGDVSYGVILSIGGMAVGGIAIGGIGLGVVTIAGVAAGALALGGVAFGWAAAGGMALAWHVAYGGMAIAMNYAIGGLAIAHEANSEAAKQLMADSTLAKGAKSVMENSRWAWLCLLLPFIAIFRRRKMESR